MGEMLLLCQTSPKFPWLKQDVFLADGIRPLWSAGCSAYKALTAGSSQLTGAVVSQLFLSMAR